MCKSSTCSMLFWKFTIINVWWINWKYNIYIILDGALASDDLYFLNLKNGEDEALWSIITTQGKSPSKRYGHTLCCINPYIVLFGGNTGTSPSNEVFIISLENTPFTWQKLEFNNEKGLYPSPRLYHACGLCTKGNANGMMIIFGGRDNNDLALNDTWGLRRHRNGTWSWTVAPYKNDHIPKNRYNVYKYNKILASYGIFININDNYWW